MTQSFTVPTVCLSVSPCVAGQDVAVGILHVSYFRKSHWVLDTSHVARERRGRLKGRPGQSEESVLEQQEIFNTITESLHDYSLASATLTKSLLLNGPPGAGKTFVTALSCLVALSMGLNCITTALMSERAVSLGGTCIYSQVVCLVSNTWIATRACKLCNYKVIEETHRIVYPPLIGCFFWDKMGQVSAQIFSTMEIIARRVSGNQLFFGGILIRQNKVRLGF